MAMWIFLQMLSPKSDSLRIMIRSWNCPWSKVGPFVFHLWLFVTIWDGVEGLLPKLRRRHVRRGHQRQRGFRAKADGAKKTLALKPENLSILALRFSRSNCRRRVWFIPNRQLNVEGANSPPQNHWIPWGIWGIGVSGFHEPYAGQCGNVLCSPNPRWCKRGVVGMWIRVDDIHGWLSSMEFWRE